MHSFPKRNASGSDGSEMEAHLHRHSLVNFGTPSFRLTIPSPSFFPGRYDRDTDPNSADSASEGSVANAEDEDVGKEILGWDNRCGWECIEDIGKRV